MSMSTVNSSSRADTSTADRGASPGRRWRDIALLAGLFCLVILGLIGIAAATGWEETKAQLLKLTFSQVLILLALSMVNYLFRGLRWHFFARALGLETGLIQNLRHFLGGFAMSVTPGRVGELVRMRWIRRETGWAIEHTAPLVLVDRASDLAAMALILAGSVALSASGVAGAVPVAILAMLAAFVVTRPRLLSGLATLAHRALGVWPRLFARIRRAAKSLDAFASPRVLAVSLLLGTLGWAAEGIAFHQLLMWMGAEIPVATALLIFTFATLAGGLTGAPGGIGGAEVAMVGLLSMQGIAPEISLPATAVIRVTTLWFAIAVGLLVFPLAERNSLKV